MAEYRIDLGIGLQSDDFAGIQKKIKSLENDPIKLKIDSSAVTSEINDIKTELNNLGRTKGLKLDTSKLETSLTDVKGDIAEIKDLLGSLGNGANMKGLASSIGQIGIALDKVSGKFDELTTDLKTLSSKDFSVNIGLKLGGGSSPSNSAAYGDYVRQELYPELKRQEQAITKYLAQYYNTNEISAVDKLYKSSGRTGGFQNIWSMLDQLEAPIKKGEVLGDRISQYRNFFKDINEMARMQGIDLSPVMSQFDKLPDELIESANNIKNGTAQVKNNLEELKNVFGGNVDGAQLSVQLDNIVADLNEIKIALQGLSSGTSLEGLTQSFDRLSETLEKVIVNANNFKNVMTGTTSGSSGTYNIAQDIERVGTSAEKVENEVVELKNALKNMGVDSDTSAINQEVEKLGITVHKVTKILNDDGSFSIKVTGIKETNDGLEQTITLMQRFNSEGIAEGTTQTFTNDIKRANDELLKLKNTADGLSSSAAITKVGKQYNDVEADFKKLSSATLEVKSSFENLTGTYSELTSAQQNYNNIMAQSDASDEQKIDAMNRLINAEKEYQNALATTKNLVADNARVEKQANSNDSLTLDKERALLRLQSLFGENSEAARKFASELNRLQKEIEECGNVDSLRRINKEINNLEATVKSAGIKTKTFGQDLKEQFSKYSSYFSIAELFMWVEQGLRDMFEQVQLIDTAMTELKKVTDETDASYNQFLSNAASRSKELGTTIDGLVSSTADFARLGYSFEDSQGLAEVANVYAVVGDEIDGVEGATESLVSTLAAFKDELSGISDTDFAMDIIDKFNEVSNNFSISSGGIGEAMQRSASSLRAANNTIDESIALITAANSVVQDPTVVGTAFKTISMRMKIHCPH